MKRAVSLFLCLVMLICVAGCAAGCGGGNAGVGEADIDTTFPLKEEVTLTFMVQGAEDTSFKTKIAENKLWKRIKEETNVNVNFQFLGTNPQEKLTLLINSGDYGDVLIGGPVLNYISASRYFASGIFKDLTDYVNKDCMPNLYKYIEERPEILGMISGVNGEIYTLPVIQGYEGMALESPIWINKAWIDKLGLSVPTTIDEFTNVLRAFKTGDPNGNGVQDEIPYLVSKAREFYSLEAIYGCWGMAFKNGELDGFSQVVDGKVRFGPLLDEYKQAVTYQSMLYKEGLMWNECFTASSSTGASKLMSDICVVGCFTSNTVATTRYTDEYICLPPPRVEGYEPCWYVNPSTVASKDRFYVTNKCKYTEVVCKFMDLFYDTENGFELEFGTQEEGRWYTNEEGKKVVRDDLTIDETNAINTKTPALQDLVERFIHAVDYSNVVYRELDQYYTVWETYKKANVLNHELWPRPYFANEDANKIYQLTTDIFYQVDTYRARWITGEGDINKEWDTYVAKLHQLGVEDMVKLMQKSYDSYLKILEGVGATGYTEY